MVSAEITQCLTRYSCDIIDMLPAQVIGRQNPFVDLISGATESANAYSNAIFRALKLGKSRMPDVYIRTVMLMGTWVTIQVVGHAADQQQDIDRRERVDRAFEWFRRVEECCTRFDPQSEMMRLSTQIGVPVPVSDLLYEAVQFAWRSRRRATAHSIQRSATRWRRADSTASIALDK